jgi:leucyl aminopeptidase (aminopeptidase T)
MYQNGNLLDAFGLVDNDVKLLIKDSKIIDVLGNDKLKQLLNSLEPEAMTVVELGIGLSEMTPTGIIGIDESILNTCHFGIGDGTFYGIDNSSSIHLDVVINNPCIEVKQRGELHV